MRKRILLITLVAVLALTPLLAVLREGGTFGKTSDPAEQSEEDAKEQSEASENGKSDAVIAAAPDHSEEETVLWISEPETIPELTEAETVDAETVFQTEAFGTVRDRTGEETVIWNGETMSEGSRQTSVTGAGQ